MGLFSKSKPVKEIIGEVADLGDKWFTSDKERQDFHYKMALIASKSDNVIARTGRGALMWMFALVGVYNFMVRDFLAIILERQLPPAVIDSSDLLEQLIRILGGVI